MRMRMPDVGEVKQGLESTLNDTIFSIDSIYGIVIILFIVWCVWRMLRHAAGSPFRIIGFLLLLQIGHVVAFNVNVGNATHVLQTIFKYDVLTALAQLCVGTRVADVLLYVQAWLNAVVGGAISIVVELFNRIMSWFQ